MKTFTIKRTFRTLVAILAIGILGVLAGTANAAPSALPSSSTSKSWVLCYPHHWIWCPKHHIWAALDCIPGARTTPPPPPAGA